MALDYSNERWVRLYTRDTATWKLIDWRARTVLLHLLRKVDRAGVLDVGDDGEIGLAAVLELPPEEIVAPGIAQLVKRGVVVNSGTAYVLPAFLAAQEAPASDAQRQRDARERRRAAAMSGAESRDDESRSVTEASRPVTDRHENGEGVTTCHSNTRQDNTDREREPDAPHPAASTGFRLEIPQPKPVTRRRDPASPRQAVKHPLPPDWQPDATLVAQARAVGVDLAAEMAKLRDWALAENAKKCDWNATARNWIRRASEERRGGPHAPAQPPRRHIPTIGGQR